MAIEVETNLDYLIDGLRLHLGDIDSSSYRYLDEWLRTALVSAVKALQSWWDYRYLVDESYNVSRAEEYSYFIFDNPPIIQHSDEQAIILMASIIIKRGSLENSSWSSGHWRDAEISFSNIEGSQSRKDSLQKDVNDLYDIIRPPTRKLARTKKQSLPGYLRNIFENNDE